MNPKVDFGDMLNNIGVKPIKGYYTIYALAEYIHKYNESLIDYPAVDTLVREHQDHAGSAVDDITYNRIVEKCTNGERLHVPAIEAILLDLGYVRQGESFNPK